MARGRRDGPAFIKPIHWEETRMMAGRLNGDSLRSSNAITSDDDGTNFEPFSNGIPLINWKGSEEVNEEEEEEEEEEVARRSWPAVTNSGDVSGFHTPELMLFSD